MRHVERAKRAGDVLAKAKKASDAGIIDPQFLIDPTFLIDAAYLGDSNFIVIFVRTP